jgi:pimeloyl-ACP methyl ester carboxylesterase
MLEKNFVQHQQQKWYYEFHKLSDDALTMVMLHEGLGSVAQWKNWPELLHKEIKINVLAYDRSGYGKSSPTPSDYPFDYLRHEAKDILPKILDSLNIKRAHLFGHSDGATIALLAAAYHPNRVESVISEAAHVIIEEVSLKGILQIKESFTEKLKKALQKYHGDKAEWVFYHWAHTWLKPEFHSWNMLEELQQIKSPVLAIQGEHDEYGSYQQLEIIDKNCPAKLIYLSNCGHHPHFEQEEKVLVETKLFLNPILN